MFQTPDVIDFHTNLIQDMVEFSQNLNQLFTLLVCYILIYFKTMISTVHYI